MDVLELFLSCIIGPIAVVYLVRYIDNKTKKNNQ